jgi:Protein of unknown function (DUF429)
MQILGVDFTSRPGRRKPIVVAAGRLVRRVLRVESIESLETFALFEQRLAQPGPWVGGFDFPFGLPRHFVDTQVLAADWISLMTWVAAMDREAFCAVTWSAFSAARGLPRHKHRAVDAAASSHSPLKTMDPVRRQAINPPVGLMFYDGAPRLAAAGLHLPRLRENGDSRVALEAYPGYVAKRLGVRQYKNDKPKHGTTLRTQRRHLLARLAQGEPLGIALELPAALARRCADDAGGDSLDAVLCALQAAWGATRAASGYGLPAAVDPVEGWICGV